MGRFAVLFCWVIAALMSISMTAGAATAEWLYDVDVPVADQSVDARAAASKQALRIVLMRVSGLRELPMNAAVTSALGSAQRYYVEYRYHEAEDAAVGAAPGAMVQVLSLRFAEAAVQRLIVDAGLPLWSSNRPTTVAWIVVADGSSRAVLGASDKNPLLNSLRARASERGLPLVVPLMDLDEQLEVTDAVVWNGVPQVIEAASQRYAADQILLGRISRSPRSTWVADWQLWAADLDKQRFNMESPTAEAVGASIADRLADDLVARYVVYGGAQQRLQIRVDGIGSTMQYGALLKYLGGLEFVDSVQVEEVRPGVVLLALATRTPWDRFRDLLALDGSLVPPDAIEGGAERHLLVWRGDQPE
jgi:hypothetical protein